MIICVIYFLKDYILILYTKWFARKEVSTFGVI